MQKCKSMINIILTNHIMIRLVELMFLLRLVKPDYKTIADFSKTNNKVIEKVFADAKEKHAIRYTRLKV